MCSNVPTTELSSIIENVFNQHLLDELQTQDVLKLRDVTIHKILRFIFC